jgi:uncharacterized membrane protein YczE
VGLECRRWSLEMGWLELVWPMVWILFCRIRHGTWLLLLTFLSSFLVWYFMPLLSLLILPCYVTARGWTRFVVGLDIPCLSFFETMVFST